MGTALMRIQRTGAIATICDRCIAARLPCLSCWNQCAGHARGGRAYPRQIARAALPPSRRQRVPIRVRLIEWNGDDRQDGAARKGC